jgi:hypothetical protein
VDYSKLVGGENGMKNLIKKIPINVRQLRGSNFLKIMSLYKLWNLIIMKEMEDKLHESCGTYGVYSRAKATVKNLLGRPICRWEDNK